MKHLRLFLITIFLSLLPNVTRAQTYTPSGRTPQADNSIGTIVNPTGVNNFNITGGLNRGQNLLHSFTDFSMTASGVDFVDVAGQNYNFGVNRAGDAPLISIDPNVAFNPVRLIVGGSNAGSNAGSNGIENYGNISRGAGEYIGLIGGDVTSHIGLQT
jgi:hypothetical protein